MNFFTRIYTDYKIVCAEARVEQQQHTNRIRQAQFKRTKQHNAMLAAAQAIYIQKHPEHKEFYPVDTPQQRVRKQASELKQQSRLNQQEMRLQESRMTIQSAKDLLETTETISDIQGALSPIGSIGSEVMQEAHDSIKQSLGQIKDLQLREGKLNDLMEQSNETDESKEELRELQLSADILEAQEILSKTMWVLPEAHVQKVSSAPLVNNPDSATTTPVPKKS